MEVCLCHRAQIAGYLRKRFGYPSAWLIMWLRHIGTQMVLADGNLDWRALLDEGARLLVELTEQVEVVILRVLIRWRAWSIDFVHERTNSRADSWRIPGLHERVESTIANSDDVEFHS